MKSRLIIFLISVLSVYIVLNRFEWHQNKTIEWDKGGYYIYLPAAFIYQDLGTFSFLPEINKKYRPSADVEWYAMYDQPSTGRRLNKYPVGVALFEFPFFLAAHLLTIATNRYPADGYSSFYQLGICLATVFWVMMGLFLLRRFLLRYFDDRTTALTLLMIALGTNLYNYTSFDFGMSHPFSFFLFAAFINAVDLWYTKQNTRHLLLAGIITGLIIITRPTNIVIVVVALLWGNDGMKNIRDRLLFFKKQIGPMCLSVFLCFAVVMFQLGYWKYATGNWVHYSYEEEGFNFANPEIWKGLFSYRKGWFVYSPIAFISFIGFIALWKYYRKMVLPLLIYFVVTIYIVFSWHQWWYGGGFGARAMVESYALMAIPLAGLLYWIKNRNSKPLKIISSAIFVCLIALNMFQTYQFSIAVIPWDHTNKEYYWRVFLKDHRTDEDWQVLNFNE